ncbi:hypothetical protein ACGF5C_31600 [Micromonospora sp. NPDC047620]|uniref:hypothetical protein n=1 Tax=Micromonospora sp. NPDC047620 TaxID=3364251 RepID=UPI00371DD970
MGLTNAERQRRYRERKRAEQRNGVTDVTSAVTGPVTRNDVTPDGPKLGPRGRRLWEQLTNEGAALKPAERVLAEEASRTADRLDTLDRILRGDEDAWMRFRSMNEDGTVVAVQINNVLAEARQQQVALKALLAELRTSQAGGAAPKTPGARPPAAKEDVGDVSAGSPGVVSLAARIAAKRGGSTAG